MHCVIDPALSFDSYPQEPVRRSDARHSGGRSSRASPRRRHGCQWARLEPLIADAKAGGCPRKTDMRAAMNAIFYLLRTGCP